MTVNLTYFKSSGKWYSDGKFDVPNDDPLGIIWDRVRDLQDRGRLPGLVEGAREFFILINVPGHPHDHPRLLWPSKVAQGVEAL